MKSFKLWMLVAVLLAGSTLLLGQTEPNLTNGFVPFGSYHGSGIDSVNLMNGNLITHIPFPQHYPQRGGSLNSEFGLIMNSKTWTIGSFGTEGTWGWISNPGLAGPWPGSSLSSMFVRTYEYVTSGGSNQVTTYSDYNYGILTSDGRQIGGTPETSITHDTGWVMNTANPDLNGTPQGGVVFDSAGNQYPISNWAGGCKTTTENDLQGAMRTTICNQSIFPANATDANGNVYTFFNGTPYDRDTLGRNIIGFGAGPVQGFNTTSDYSGCVSPLAISAATLSSYPAANGATNQIKTCYSTVSLQTAFNIAGAAEWTGSTTLPVTIILADGSKWSFTYDSYGNVTFIGLPLGGSISYQWTTVGFPTINVPVSRTVSQRTITDNNGHSYIWKYQWMTQQVNPTSVNGTYTNVVTDPLGNDSVHVFTNFGPIAGFYETGTLYYQGSSGSGQLLKRIDTAYLAPVGGVTPPNVTNTILASHCWPIRVQTTIYPSGKVSLVTNTYDTAGFAKVVTEKEYDWGQGSAGPLLRETDTTYQWQVNTAYLNAHLINLPASVVVKDGNGNKLAETDYTYDESAYLQTYTGALPSGTHATAPNPSPVRGNLTTVSRWLNTGGTVVTHSNWYDTGEVYQQIDALGNITTHSYDPAYAGAYSTKTCSPPTGTIAHCVSGTYDFNTGLLTSFTNENATTQASGNTPGDAAHTSTYAYDFLSRMISAKAPPDPSNGNAQAQTTFAYSAANVFPFTVTRTKSITPSLTDSATSTYDGLGRVYKTQHPLPNGTAEVDTGYDGLGRAVSVTNPYFSTSDPTYGITQTAYDALGRSTQVTKQDGSLATVSYADNCTVATDEAGKQRKSCADALGRLIEVDEPNPGAAATLATGSLTISGNEQTANSQPATSGQGSVTISGGEGSTEITTDPCQDMEPPSSCPHTTTVWDNGTVSITVNGHTYSANYNQTLNTTAAAMASVLAAAINADSAAVVTASVSGTTVNLIAKTTGAATNYSLSSSAVSGDPGDFAYSTFGATASGANLTDGQNASSTPDTGTVTATVNGTQYTVSYGAGDTSSSIASRLASAISAGSYANASPSGGAVNLTSKTSGGGGNYSISAAYTWNTSQFVNPSFTTSTSGGSLTGGYNASDLNNNPYVTLYTYDPMGNLLRVDQKGSAPTDNTQWRTRLFTYNSLSQLLTAFNPESGTISYTYDPDGNLLQKTSPAANQTGSATTTISFCYDARNRVTGKAYSAQSCTNGSLPTNTAVVTYSYDQGANGIGRMTSLTDQAGSGSYSYDPFGRVSSEQRTIAGVSKTMSYDYNLDGSVKAVHYPSGAAVTYTPDSAGRMLSAVDSGNNINYVTGATYGPDSAITGFINGNTGSFAGISNTFSYNKRLQPVNMSASFGSPVQTVFSLNYDFHLGNGNNGNVWGITNYKDNTRSQSFTYDQLNRLTSAQNAGTDCAQTVIGGKTKFWGNAYSYDAWGNLLAKTVTKCSAENLVLTAGNNNQLQGGYLHDAAGNMTHDATSNLNYTYDQENRVTGAGGFTYVYDDEGNRVEKTNGSTGTLYWHMTPGIVGESDLTGAMKSEYVFFDGERVARRDLVTPTGVFYYFSDHLKTASVITDSTGNIKSESDYYPWGGELQFTNNDSNHYKFTGKERDSESGLDYFGARYYSNGLGRFITPDWAAKATAVPYAEFADQQTINLYTYVRNIPTTRSDFDGHDGGAVAIGAEIGTFIEPGVGTAVGAGIGLTVEAGMGLYLLHRYMQSHWRNPYANKLTGRGGHHGGTHAGAKVQPGKGNPAPGTQTKAGNPVKPYDTGTYKDLKGRSTTGDGLDIHHVPQAGQAEQIIPGYDRQTGPAIALPEAEHQSIPTVKGDATLTPEEQVNKDVGDLRKNTNAPEEAVKQAEQNAKKIIPKKD